MTPTQSQARVGIVGAGIRGSLFGRALSQHPSVEVVGIADPNARVGQATAAALGIPHYASLSELLEAQRLTAVVIATPDFAHRDAAVAAAEAGLDLLIEKPLATTSAEAEEIAAAARRGGGKVMVGFENRWNPRFISARAAIAAEVGDVRHQVIHLNDTRWVPTSMLSWAGKSSPAWFLMPHSLDLALWLSGKTVESVYASGTRGVLAAQGVDTWDSIDAVLHHTDGTSTTLHSGWILPESFPAVYDLRYEVVGTTGALRVIGADQGVHLYADRTSWPQWGTYELDGKLLGFPVDMATSFGDFITGADIEVPGLADGLVVTRVIEAVHRSLEIAAPVAVS
jgi:predicted dehydrogenase